MSARLLTFLILPTLALAVGLASSRAAQQFAALTPPSKTTDERLVTKVYQVADLVIPITGSEPAAKDTKDGSAIVTNSSLPSAMQLYRREHSKACPKCTCAKAAAKTQEWELEDLITSTISPLAWNFAGGTWSYEYFPMTHSLVVKATPAAQEQIADLLVALRRLQDQQTAIEVRFVSVPCELYGHLKTGFGFKDPKDGPMASLNEEQMVKFFNAAQADMQTHIMQAPKITMFNEQKSTMRVLDNRFFATSLTLRWDDNVGALLPVPVNEPVELGLEMNLRPAISADRKSVNLDFNLRNTRLEREDVELIPVEFVLLNKPGKDAPNSYMRIHGAGTPSEKTPRMSDEECERLKDKNAVIFTQFIQKPKLAVNCLETKLNLPDGKTAVLFGWKQTSEVTDAVPVLSKLPYIGRLYQHKRQVPETVLVLVTPRVIVPQEEEERQTGLLPVLPQVAEEVLPMPKPAPVKAAPTPNPTQDESDLQIVERVWNGWNKADSADKTLNDLMAKYHKLCAAGKKDAARKVALKALKIDPTCFDRKAGE
jgi:hypothetical protein